MRVPNFRRYFVGQSLSSVGTWFHTLALALVVVDLTDSGAALGGVVALQWLPLLALGSYAGALLDRHDPRAVLVITNLVSAALGLALVAVTASGNLDVWWLGVFSLGYGLVLPFDRPAVQILPVELVAPPLVSNALGLSSMIQSLARLVGPRWRAWPSRWWGRPGASPSTPCRTCWRPPCWCASTAPPCTRGCGRHRRRGRCARGSPTWPAIPNCGRCWVSTPAGRAAGDQLPGGHHRHGGDHLRRRRPGGGGRPFGQRAAGQWSGVRSWGRRWPG